MVAGWLATAIAGSGGSTAHPGTISVTATELSRNLRIITLPNLQSRDIRPGG